ncbi:GAF domain-containing protein [Sorangium sp. So ce341]|uniref:hybrid sensor histidine kinase/response regulator n=1 Tax=Sorangium sp. So ce341 TaxID=3133302 RepID=UPI003F5F1C9A
MSLPRRDGAAALSPPGVRIEEMLAAEALALRPPRLPDHAAENRALIALAAAMAGSLEDVLPKLASLLLELCRADSAGVSVLEVEDGREVFRWVAIAGAFAHNAGGTMPRHGSPCGAVLDCDAALLFSHPARHFAAGAGVEPAIVEALTVPFHAGGAPIGTVWVMAHSEERKFDAEDARLASSLSRFAATAVHALAQARDARRASEALRESEGRHRFLAELAAATQPLVDPGEVMAVTARLLAEHLGVDRCAYAEVEDERVFVITGDHTRGVRSIVGRWPVADFGPELVRLMLANEPYVIDDVDADPRAGGDLAAYRATEIQAVICVPLHKSGRFTAAMAVHQKVPRRWTHDEVGLVRLVVGRCWEAIERARATRSVRERDERLDYAVRLSGLGFWYCDLPFDELIWDDRVKEHFWLPPDARVTIGTFYERLHPDDREPTRRAIEASIRERIPYDMDYRTVDPVTGAFKWVRALGGTAYAPDGTPRRFDGVTVDVTARKLDEERVARLLELEREQGRLLKQVADAALTIHASGSLGSVLQGITEEARRIIGAHQAVTRLNAGIDGSQAVNTVSMSGKYDGWRGPAVPSLQNGVYAVVCRTNRPVRLTQVELEAPPAWLTQVELEPYLNQVEPPAPPAWLTQVEPGQPYLNQVEPGQPYLNQVEPAAASPTQVAAAPPPQVAAAPPTQVAAAPPTQVEPPPLLPQGIVSGDADRRPPMRGWLVAPFIGRSGENLGLIHLCDKRDGEFTESDEAILVQLAHIASVAIENAQLYDQLRDQDRRKDEFLATLAHELRNPLAPIRTGLEILKVAGSADQARKILDMMDRQVGHMVRMVDDLLDVSRITRGKVELRKERIDLRAVLNSALETSRPLIEAAAHELTVRLPPAPLRLDADPTRLAQVFANLLNNAAKYTPSGGSIRLAAQRDGAAVVVRVADNGVGIPADMLSNVFDMFTQVGRSIDRAQGGLGIGLTLVKRLVELHGGSIHAESDGAGRGSTFTIRLPLAAAEEAAPRPSFAGAANVAPPAALRILVVDDSVDGAESLALLLRISGHETRAVHTGPDALTATRELGADIVFLDIGLPGMNGYEVARRLRAERDLSGLFLVALTGWGTEDDRRQAREAGFDHHLTKPVDAAEVKRLVARIAAARRQGG